MLVKICGLTCQEDVATANALGADFCGFIFHPKSPRYVAPEVVATLDSGHLKRVGVFVSNDVEHILHVMQIAQLDLVQLHGEQSTEVAREIGENRVIRVLWPQRYCHKALFYRDIMKFADSCAFYLFDAGQKGGGSGKKLDWDYLAGLATPHPWLLAGGLNAKTAAQALKLTHAAGVDLNSGIESAPGKKDASSMREAIQQVRLLKTNLEPEK